VSEDPGFAPEDVFELGDVIAHAFMAGMIPGTLRFSRAVLGAGYRRVAEPIPEFEPTIQIPNAMHYFVLGPSEDHPNMFGWQCSCTKSSRYSYADLPNAFANALAHMPEGVGWRAKGQHD
jgi:hypothetical protein